MGEVVERKNASIFEGSPWHDYLLKEKKLNKKEKNLVSLIWKTALHDYSTEDLQSLFLKNKEQEFFIEKVKDFYKKIQPYSSSFLDNKDEPKVISIVNNFLKQIDPGIKNNDKVIEEIIEKMFGLSVLTPLLEDDELEEIMVNGSKKPVFVFDRKLGLCKTNVIFESDKEIEAVIKKIGEFVGKKINENTPLLDARLPDGSRVNATLGLISPKGPTITIRKFRKRPITVTEMIENGTLNPELAAFLWLCVDGMQVSPMNIIIAGGTGSGKTSTLNALSVFVPPKERIVTIEDTLELNLYDRENWVQLEARMGIRNMNEIDLNDLLKNAIRMRPDRILVGEVRGKEASSMFTAMDIGHQGIMCTLHANSAKETVLRLQSDPMDVPVSMFSLLDLIIMQHRVYWPRKGLIRRIMQVSEVSVMGEHVLLNDVFLFDREKDHAYRTNLPSGILEKLSFLTGLKTKDLKDEIILRSSILKAMANKKIFDSFEIKKVIEQYWDNPSKVAKKFKLV